jgi:hypothetical protein
MAQLTQAQLNEVLEKAAKYDKYQAINKRSYKYRNAKIKVILRKAAEAGITATEQEIDAELNK